MNEEFEDEYRRKKNIVPRINQDSDYYGYTDNNAGRGIDNDFSAKSTDIDSVGVFRKRKCNKIKLIRKRKKCKCK